MTKVGVIGLGMMGNTHLDIYGSRDDVEIVAISDADPKRLSGEEKAGGNIEGQAQGGADLSNVKRYADGMELIHDDDVEIIDICLPTPLHHEFGEAAMAAGKHVMIEKPLARTAADADALADAADQAEGVVMVGMCMRFWPGWTWLKRAIDEQIFGKPLGVHFTRVAQHPGGDFYHDGKANGGALLDLHVHDTDFVKHCFGMPEAVFSTGYSKITREPDYVVTQYLYDNGCAVTAEGGWAMADGFGFHMRFVANFEQATAVFDIGQEPVLKFYQDGEGKPVDIETGMGYPYEIAYSLDCIATGKKPETVTVRDAAASIRIAEAEAMSLQRRNRIALDPA